MGICINKPELVAGKYVTFLDPDNEVAAKRISISLPALRQTGSRPALTDILASLNPSEGNESLSSLVQSLGDGESGFSLTLCSDDGGL